LPVTSDFKTVNDEDQRLPKIVWARPDYGGDYRNWKSISTSGIPNSKESDYWNRGIGKSL